MEKTAGKRVEWIDAAKAIGILTVIIGHSVRGLLCGVIYSFHMVLFFLLSAYSGRYSQNRSQYLTYGKKTFIRLLIPVFVCFAVKQLIQCITHGIDSLLGFIQNSLMTLLYSSGNIVVLDGITINAIGLVWFLVVLFCAREIYDALQMIIKNKVVIFVLTMALSFAGVCIGRVRFLYFSFDITLAVLVLFCIAHITKNVFDPETDTLKQLVIYFIAWVIFVILPYFLPEEFREHLNLAGRVYPLFPLCYIGAIAATAFVACVSVCLMKIKLEWIKNALLCLGRNTMYVLIIHYFDYLWRPLWSITGNMYVKCILRLACDMLLFALVMLVKKTIHKARRHANA